MGPLASPPPGPLGHLVLYIEQGGIRNPVFRVRAGRNRLTVLPAHLDPLGVRSATLFSTLSRERFAPHSSGYEPDATA